jgi:exopolysaccharide biosynthesis protein
LPALTSEEEAFVRTEADGKKVDSIGSQRTAARTAFGITPDSHALLVCIAGKGQDEFSAGISLPDLANLLKHLGCQDAINFDGGTSTTMVANQDWIIPDGTAAAQTPEKLVKSGLAIVSNE